MVKLKIAIIGSGLAGLSLANDLKGKASITIFEKARGVGGRMSTRYTSDFQFDHGAQFFTARTKNFQHFLKPFIQQGVVQEWQPKVATIEFGQKRYKRDWFEPHYVASPKMNALCKALSQDQDVRLKTNIVQLSLDSNKWFLKDGSGEVYGPFDWVVSSAPAPQAQALFPEAFSGSELMAKIKMQGCYSLMLGFAEDLTLHWNAAKVKNSPIGWIAVNSSKPSRGSHYSLLVQTSNEWAENNIGNDQEIVQSILIDELTKLLKIEVRGAIHTSLHRWRYAATFLDVDIEKETDIEKSGGNGYYIDEKLKLAACGDWCLKGHVESAYLSASSLALELQRKMFLPIPP